MEEHHEADKGAWVDVMDAADQNNAAYEVVEVAWSGDIDGDVVDTP